MKTPLNILLLFLTGCFAYESKGQEEIVELINRGQLEKAVLECNRFIENDSSNAEVYRMRAELAIEFENYTTAFNDLNRAIELTNGKDFELFALMGHTLFQLEEFERALNCFYIVHSNDSTASSVNFNLGLSLFNLERYDEAVPYLKSEIRQNPNYASGYEVLAEVYRELEMHDKSAEMLRKVRAIDDTK